MLPQRPQAQAPTWLGRILRRLTPPRTPAAPATKSLAGPCFAFDRLGSCVTSIAGPHGGAQLYWR